MKSLLLLSTMFFAGSSFAEDKGAPPAPKPEYAPSNKSAFDPKGIARNPFLPIGYTGAPKTVEAVAPVAVVTPDMFKVSSIIVGAPGVAVINGKDYAEGDRVPVPGQEVMVTLSRVSDGQVILTHPDPKVGNNGRIVVRN